MVDTRQANILSVCHIPQASILKNFPRGESTTSRDLCAPLASTRCRFDQHRLNVRVVGITFPDSYRTGRCCSCRPQFDFFATRPYWTSRQTSCVHSNLPGACI